MRLIDADLIQYEPMLSPKGNGMYDDVMVAYKSQINDLPTIERKKGKWINHGQYADFFPHCEYRCSECDTPYLEIEMIYNFCPNCGADMRGD